MRCGRSRSWHDQQNGRRNDLRRRPGSLRADALPARGAQRAAPARDLARAVEQLRRRPTAGDEPRHRPPCVRPRNHALRPREQLRPAVRLRGGDLRTPAPHRPPPVPRRAGDLHEGGVRHVARPVRGVGLPEVPARESRPEPGADGARLRRHLLLAPRRPRHAARGDDGSARRRGSPGEGAVRRDLVVLAGANPRGGRDPRPPRHAAPDPPALVLDAEPLDRGRAARYPGGPRRRLHRLLPARPGAPHRSLRGRDPRGLADRARPEPPRRPAQRADRRQGLGRCARSRRRAARRSRAWRSPGRCATRG